MTLDAGHVLPCTSVRACNTSEAIQQNRLLHFLTTLYEFKVEIEERESQYFDYQPLRYRALGDSPFELDAHGVPADPTHIMGSNSSALCEQVSRVYGLSLVAAKDGCELNPVERLFQHRLNEPVSHPSWLELDSSEELRKLSGLCSRANVLAGDIQAQMLEAIYDAQVSARLKRAARLSDLAYKLSRRTIERDGALTYYVVGTGGSAVILLNALAHGLEYWYPLIDRFMLLHRVILWEPRSASSTGAPILLEGQAEDVSAILQNERISDCHLVGWCTGPKVGIETYLNETNKVRSMVFLNATFKCHGMQAGLDTAYEHNLESLCQIVQRNPGMAGLVQQSLKSRSPDGTIDLDLLQASASVDRERLGASVLARINDGLKAHVITPFRTEESTRVYIEQLLDFWSHDTRAKASAVNVAVLLLAAEYDEIASPAMSYEAAGWLPHASLVEMRGASHYCLYDRAEWVASLLETFFRDVEDSGARVVRQ